MKTTKKVLKLLLLLTVIAELLGHGHKWKLPSILVGVWNLIDGVEAIREKRVLSAVVSMLIVLLAVLNVIEWGK